MENQLSGVLARLLTYDKEQLPKLDLDFARKAELTVGIPAEKYFADRERINSSSIKKLLRSPRHFLNSWKGSEVEEEADHFRIGRAAHMMLLEPNKFREFYVIEPEFEGYTKSGKPTKSSNSSDVIRQREEWRATLRPGAIVLTEEELGNLIGMIEAVLEHPISSSMLKNGIAEATIHWTDRDTGVMCKGRPDYLTFEDNGDYHLIDFKTTRNIQVGSFIRDTHNLQYHLSMAFYADGLMEKYGRLPTTLTLIPVEKTSPYEATVFALEDEWYEVGKRMYKDGLKIYRRCLDSGIWPAFSSRAESMGMPSYAQNYISPEFEFNQE